MWTSIGEKRMKKKLPAANAYIRNDHSAISDRSINRSVDLIWNELLSSWQMCKKKTVAFQLSSGEQSAHSTSKCMPILCCNNGGDVIKRKTTATKYIAKRETPKRNCRNNIIIINERVTITDRLKEVCVHLNYGTLNKCVQIIIKYGFNGWNCVYRNVYAASVSNIHLHKLYSIYDHQHRYMDASTLAHAQLQQSCMYNEQNKYKRTLTFGIVTTDPPNI